MRKLSLWISTAGALTFAFTQSGGGYPAHWWTPIPPALAPAWEILPQAARPGEVILSKRNELGILSNFAATPFTLRGKRYASVEGFWQMMLYPEGPHDPRAKAPGIVWPHTREEVAGMTAFEAKDAGTLAEENMRKMGIGWVTFEGRRFPYRSKKKGVHYGLILEAMRAKLDQNPEVRKILLSTGTLILRPDHIEEPDPPAEWLYFRIWMDIRTELQRQSPETAAILARGGKGVSAPRRRAPKGSETAVTGPRGADHRFLWSAGCIAASERRCFWRETAAKLARDDSGVSFRHTGPRPAPRLAAVRRRLEANSCCATFQS
jgi:predicted NAD-dependent protein-ADP-ribosyltransferase YbiA (DUF1768 family)